MFEVVEVPVKIFFQNYWLKKNKLDNKHNLFFSEFGNYPPEDEYKMIVTSKNNVITVRKKFPRPTTVTSAPILGAEEADSIRVLQKSQPRWVISHK